MFAGRNPERDTLIIYGFLCVRFRLSQEFINNALHWPIPCTNLALLAEANIDITCEFLILCASFKKKDYYILLRSYKLQYMYSIQIIEFFGLSGYRSNK